jgi:hypothetical protein
MSTIAFYAMVSRFLQWVSQYPQTVKRPSVEVWRYLWYFSNMSNRLMDIHF